MAHPYFTHFEWQETNNTYQCNLCALADPYFTEQKKKVQHLKITHVPNIG